MQTSVLEKAVCLPAEMVKKDVADSPESSGLKGAGSNNSSDSAKTEKSDRETRIAF